MRRMAPRLLVSVEGSIGSGKSTLLALLREKGHVVSEEDVAAWTNFEGHNFLREMYGGDGMFAFQMLSLLTLVKNCRTSPAPCLIAERVLGRRCFISLLKATGALRSPEVALVEQWEAFALGELRLTPDLIIYLRTSPQVALERLRRRGRPEEQTIDLGYLEALHKEHELWLSEHSSCPVLWLDGDLSEENARVHVDRCESAILALNRQ